MELITIPRIRVKELQTLAEESIRICKNIKKLEEAVASAEKALEDFKNGMLKDQVSGMDKRLLDQKRDTILSGLFSAMRAEKRFPHKSDEAKNTVILLDRAVFKYGSTVTKLPYNEETAAIDNILAEIEKVDISPLAASGISRWIPQLQQANNDFKLAAEEFITERSIASEYSAATTIAPILINSLHDLYTLLFALVQVGANKQMRKTYQQISELVDSYR